ncbi:MAG: DUF6493 family protein [Janthinobacterium lividum]
MNNNLVVEEFEQIIRHKTLNEFVPFLASLKKSDVVPARERLKSLKKELNMLVQVSTNSWGSKGTYEQFENLFLAGFAVYSRTEVLNGAINNSWLIGSHPNTKPIILKKHFLALMLALRPEWLHDWLLRQQAIASEWAVDYELLRALEQEQLIPFSPALTARSLPSSLARQGWDLSNSDNVPTNVLKVIATTLGNDHLFLTRDLPLVFEFDNPIPSEWARIQPPMPLNQRGEQQDDKHLYPWQVWNQRHPLQTVGWQALLINLISTHHLDRADVLTRCLLALRRDFRRPLLTWFKELFVKLHATVAERLARQNDLLELLAHPLPLVVNFAIEQLKAVWLEPNFEPAPLLLYADNLLARPDLKTSLKTLLSGLGKLAQHQTALAPTVGRLLARALTHADTAVQQYAAKNLAGLLKAKKLALSTQDTSAIAAVIEGQAELLGAGARAVLAPWLAAQPATSATPAKVAAYVPKSEFIPDLSSATAIEPVADWHELLFLTGQVLKHDDPTALERWLDGLLRLQGQLPAGHQEQLRPYVLQVLPQLQKISAAEAATLLSGPIPIWGHDGLAEALLLSWAADFRIPRVETVVVQSSHLARMPLLEVEHQRYAHAEGLLRNQQALPLLSTPTHAPHWVAPSTLISKLLAYEKAGQEPAPADLALALARAAHAHPTEAATARHLLSQLHHTGLRELLAWFLGPTNVELPVPAYEAAPMRSPAGPSATLTEALPELWAVAARTKAPYRAFSTLPAWLGYDYAGVAHPLHLVREVVAQQTTYDASYQASGEPVTHCWTELYWRSGAAEPAPSALLLYSPPPGSSRQGSWETNQLLAQDFPYLTAALPHYPAPLFEYILRCAAWADNFESSERDLVAQALRALLTPGPAHSPTATVVLASGLLHHTSLCRSLGQEALLRAVTTGQLQPDALGRVLGQQLTVGYAPAARLTNCLAALSGIDALTDSALHQVLEALLPELPALPIRNLRKLLDLYAELVARTRRPVPAVVRTLLHAWRAAPSLKKVATVLAA